MAKPLQFALPGWKQGLLTLGKDWETPPDALRVCTNFDVTRSGQLVRRPGRTRLYTGTIAPGTLYGRDDELYFVESGDLKVYTPTGIRTLATVGSAPMAYAESHGVLYYSNGRVTGRIINGTATHWGLPIPAQQPALAVQAEGALHPGTYQVAITYASILPNGAEEESGTGLANEVTLDTQGGIVLSAIPSGGNDYVNVYVSHANGSALFLYGTYAATVSGGIQLISDPTGPELETQFHAPPPPGPVVCAYNARLLVGSDTAVYLTEPFYPSLVDYRESVLPYDAPITLLHAVRDGVYVGTQADLWFISGLDSEALQQTRVKRYGVTLGTDVAIPQTGQGGMIWSERGILALGDSGQVKELFDARIALDGVPIRDGVAGYREARPSGQRTAIFIVRPGTRHTPTLVYATTATSWSVGQTATIVSQSATVIAASTARTASTGLPASVQTGGLIATAATSATTGLTATISQATIVAGTRATTATTGYQASFDRSANVEQSQIGYTRTQGQTAAVNAQNQIVATQATSESAGKLATVGWQPLTLITGTRAISETAGLAGTVNAQTQVQATLATGETAGLTGAVDQDVGITATVATGESAGLIATVVAIPEFAILGTSATSETTGYSAAVNNTVLAVATLATSESAGLVAAVNAQTQVTATAASSETASLAAVVQNNVSPTSVLATSETTGLLATVSQAHVISATAARSESTGLTASVVCNNFVVISATLATSETRPRNAQMDHLFGRLTADGDTRITADGARRTTL